MERTRREIMDSEKGECKKREKKERDKGDR